MTTLREVAQEVGMSISTVSRAISGNGQVSPEARELIRQTVDRLGFKPNPIAQGLRTGRTNAVAVVVSDIEQGSQASLTKCLQQALEEVGVEMILMNLGHDVSRLNLLAERVEAMRLRGVILAATDRLPPKLVRALVDGVGEGVVVLSVGQRLDRYTIPSFVHDETGAAEMAVTYLLKNKRWPIAYCSRVRSSITGEERLRGYMLALEKAGIPIDQDLIWDMSDSGLFRQAAGFNAVTQALQRKTPFRALLAGSDEIALGAMAAVLDGGFQVPKDVAIIGFGGLDWGASVRPRLTTLTSDLTGIGKGIQAHFGANRLDKAPMLTMSKRELCVRASA